MVGRQLHDKRGGFAGKHSCLFKHDSGNDNCSHTNEVSRSRHPCRAAEYGTCNHGNERNLCATRYKGCSHDCHAAVALVFNGPAGHDTRNTASDTYEHRDERLSGKTELAEHAVQHKCYSCHIAAGFQESKHQKENQHLGHKAQNSSDTGYDTIKNQPLEPGCCVCSIKALLYNGGNTGNPDAVISRIRLIAYLGQCCNGIIIILYSSRLIEDFKRLLVFNCIFKYTCRGFSVFHNVGFIAVCNQRSLSVAFGKLRVAAVYSEQVETITEDTVICKISSRSTHGNHCNPVNQEHDNCKNRKTEPAVCHNTVYLVRNGSHTFLFLFVAGLYYFGNVDVTLVGNNALCIVIQFLLSIPYVVFNVREFFR